MTSLTLALIARIPPAGVAAFRAYEAAVLPLLERHGGTLQRRLSNHDGTVELHVVHFATSEGFAAFRADPDRAAAAPLMAECGASTELIEVEDVEPIQGGP